MYIRKRRGPRTEPCRTPWVIALFSEFTPFIETCWNLLVRKLFNQSFPRPLMPQLFNLVKRISWFAVSKTFWRSMKTPHGAKQSLAHVNCSYWAVSSYLHTYTESLYCRGYFIWIQKALLNGLHTHSSHVCLLLFALMEVMFVYLPYLSMLT